MSFGDYPIQNVREVTARPEIVFTKGQGSWLTDHTGVRAGSLPS